MARSAAATTTVSIAKVCAEPCADILATLSQPSAIICRPRLARADGRQRTIESTAGMKNERTTPRSGISSVATDAGERTVGRPIVARRAPPRGAGSNRPPLTMTSGRQQATTAPRECHLVVYNQSAQRSANTECHLVVYNPVAKRSIVTVTDVGNGSRYGRRQLPSTEQSPGRPTSSL